LSMTIGGHGASFFIMKASLSVLSALE